MTPPTNHADPARSATVSGVCWPMFAYDAAQAVDLDAAERIAGGGRVPIHVSRRAPSSFAFRPAPLRLRIPVEPVSVRGVPVAPFADVAIFDFGGISVAYEFPVDGPVDQLPAIGDELFENPELLASSRRLVERLIDRIAPALRRPALVSTVEDYAVYHLRSVEGVDTPEALLRVHGPVLARTLRAELNGMSSEETDDALAGRVAAGERDVALIDWNAAILMDPDPSGVRLVLEYANVELLEMRVLDDRLDAQLDEAYASHTRRRARFPSTIRTRREMDRVAQMHVDGALLFEGVNNALKLVGDPYLARVYALASRRFRLTDRDAAIERKLRVLDSIYQKLHDHRSAIRAEILEWIIIVLIAGEIVLSLVR